MSLVGGVFRAVKGLGAFAFKAAMPAARKSVPKISQPTIKMMNMEICLQITRLAGLPCNLLVANLRRILEKNGRLAETEALAIEEGKISVQDMLLSIRITDNSDGVSVMIPQSKPVLCLKKSKQ